MAALRTSASGIASSLASHGFAFVRLDESDASCVRKMRAVLLEFFQLPAETKLARAGPFRDLGNEHVVGYKAVPRGTPPGPDGPRSVPKHPSSMPDEFLELRLAGGRPEPPLQLPQAAARLRAGALTLAALGREVLEALAEEGLVHPSIVGAVDCLQGGLSDSAVRACMYAPQDSGARQAEPADGPGGHAPEEEDGFGMHTDTTFLTLVPVSDAAGLWVQGRDGWVSEAAAKELGADLVVFPGEYLEVFSERRLRAAVHCVRRSDAPRLSSPVLLRVDRAARAMVGGRERALEPYRKMLSIQRRRQARRAEGNWVLGREGRWAELPQAAS